MESEAPSGAPPTGGRPRGNLIALGVTQVLVSGGGLLIQILLARYLGRESYGTYSFLLSVAALFAFVADMKLQVLLARDVARDPGVAKRLLGTGLVTVGMTSTLAILLVAGYAAVADGDGNVVLAAVIAGVSLGTAALQAVIEAVLQGLRRMQPLMLANLAGRLVYVFGTAALLFAGFDLVGVFLAQAAAPLVTTLVLWRWFGKHIGRPTFGTLRDVAQMIRDAVPYSLDRLFGAIYLASDVLIIKAFYDDAEVGTYRVAALLLLQLPLLAIMLNRGIFPKIAQAFGDKAAAGAEVLFSARILLVVSVPMAVGGVMLASPLLVLLVGEGYDSAVIPFIIMMPLLPVRFLNNLAGNALSALNEQRARTRASGYSAVFNLVANLAVVPFYGATGAAVTTLITGVLLLGYHVVLLAPHTTGVRLLGPMVRLVIPTIAMAGIVFITPSWHVLLRILAGAVVFGALSYAFKAWQLGDLRTLRAI